MISRIILLILNAFLFLSFQANAYCPQFGTEAKFEALINAAKSAKKAGSHYKFILENRKWHVVPVFHEALINARASSNNYILTSLRYFKNETIEARDPAKDPNGKSPTRLRCYYTATFQNETMDPQYKNVDVRMTTILR